LNTKHIGLTENLVTRQPYLKHSVSN
jgi:hypothetical protein